MSTHSVDTEFSSEVASPAAATRSTVPDIATLDKHGYLFGSNLKASLSPFLHSVIYSNLNLRWAQLPLDSLDLPLFLRLARHPDFYGASVTMPHKVAILPHLDQLTEECRQVGACNTVFVRPDPKNPGRKLLCGTNTDVIGVRDSFLENIKDRSIWEGRPGLVLGGGGAARSAVYALWKWMGVSDIYIVNRDETEARDLIRDCTSKGFGDRLKYVGSVEEAKKLDVPGAVVACVPDYPPSAEGEKRARRITTELMAREGSKKGVMLEMCYNPTPYTRLGAIVESWGWTVILGTEALIYQGLEQDTYWTEKGLHELPVDKVHHAIAGKVAERAKEAKL